jgi:hypothetical protein
MIEAPPRRQIFATPDYTDDVDESKINVELGAEGCESRSLSEAWSLRVLVATAFRHKGAKTRRGTKGTS